MSRRIVAAASIVLLLVAPSAMAQDASPRPAGGIEVRHNLFAYDVPSVPKRSIEKVKRLVARTPALRLEGWTKTPRCLLITTRGKLKRLCEPLGRLAPFEPRRRPVPAVRYAMWLGRMGQFVQTRDHGREIRQLHWVESRSGESVPLTSKSSPVLGAVMSSDGRYLAYASEIRNEDRGEVYLLDLESDTEPRRVHRFKGYVWPALVTDSGAIYLSEASGASTNVWLLDSTTGRRRAIAPDTRQDEGHPSSTYLVVAAEGSQFAYLLTDRYGEWRELARYDTATSELVRVLPGLAADVEYPVAAAASGLLAFATNEGGLSRLHVLVSGEGLALQLPALPAGVIRQMRFDSDGERLALVIDMERAGTDIFVLDLVDLDAPTVERFTQVLPSELEQTPVPESFRYETFDDLDGRRRTIQAWLYRPPGAGPFPVIVHLHGGPALQFRPTHQPIIGHWVRDLGIAVIAPNVRGSTGFGKSFEALDNGVNRGGAVKDVGTLLDWISSRPDLDASRVAVSGGSYGGFLALAALVAYPDRIRAGSALAGPTDLVALPSEQPRRWIASVLGSEDGDPSDSEVVAALEALSPLYQAESIRAPLFLAHGENDPRVPIAHSDRLWSRLQAAGADVCYLRAAGEGHGFSSATAFYYHLAAEDQFWRVHLCLGPRLAEDSPQGGARRAPER